MTNGLGFLGPLTGFFPHGMLYGTNHEGHGKADSMIADASQTSQKLAGLLCQLAEAEVCSDYTMLFHSLLANTCYVP